MIKSRNFVRREKQKTLILQNVVTGTIEERRQMISVDEPESPDIGPTGRQVVLSALQDAVGDIFMVDLDTDDIINLTNDEFADSAPTFSLTVRSSFISQELVVMINCLGSTSIR